jgi:hypothetical protein
VERAAGGKFLPVFFSWTRELTTSTMSVRFRRSSMKLWGISPAMAPRHLATGKSKRLCSGLAWGVAKGYVLVTSL